MVQLSVLLCLIPLTLENAMMQAHVTQVNHSQDLQVQDGGQAWRQSLQRLTPCLAQLALKQCMLKAVVVALTDTICCVVAY